jgi:LemA protein
MRVPKSLVALTLALSVSGCGYNRIQELDERAEQARSNIGVALQNRNQLIPNLVATVKGAAEFERGTYTDVARARAGQSVAAAEQQLTQASQQLNQAVQSNDTERMRQADDAVRASIGTFINVAREAYPNLTATQTSRHSRTSWPRARTRSPWPAPTTTSRCSGTTPTSAASPR